MEKYTLEITNNLSIDQVIILFGGSQHLTTKSTVFDEYLSIRCEPKPYEEILKDFSLMGIVKRLNINMDITYVIHTEDLQGNSATRAREHYKETTSGNDQGLFAIDPYTVFKFTLPAKKRIIIKMEAELRHPITSASSL